MTLDCLLARTTAQQSNPATDTSLATSASTLGGTAVEERNSLLEQAQRLTPDAVQTRRDAAEANGPVGEEVKNRLRQNFERALDNLKQRAEIEQQIASYKADIEARPKLLTEISEQLDLPVLSAEPDLPEGASVAEMESLRKVDQEQLDSITRNLESWESRARVRLERRPQMPNIIEAARVELETVEQALESPLPEETDPVSQTAIRTERESLVALRSSQYELARYEQVRYEALADLFPLQRDLLTRKKDALEKRMQRWNELLASARQQEAAQQKQEAQLQLELAHPSLRQLAERNSQLAEQRSLLQASRQAWESELAEIEQLDGELRSKFQAIQEQQKLLGLTTVIGLELRSQRNSLPNERKYYKRMQNNENEVRAIHAQRLKLDVERRKLADINQQVDVILEQVAGVNDTQPSESQSLRLKAREYVLQQRDYLDDLLEDLEAGVGTLSKLDIAGRRLVDRTVEYRNFIDEQVLWIRSSPPLDLDFPTQTSQAIRSLLSPILWMPVIDFLQQDFRDLGFSYIAILLLVVLLAFFSTRQRKLISELHQRAHGLLNPGIGPNLLAIFLSVVLAATWAIALGFIGWRLSRSEHNLTLAVGEGLISSSVLLLVMQSLRRLCSKGGVAELFLQWPQSVLQCIRDASRKYALGGVPLIFLFVTSNRLEALAITETIGRLALILFCLLVCWIVGRTLRPTGAILTTLRTSHPDSRILMIRWVWYLPLVFAPLALAGLALAGFQYTAEQLIFRYQSTLLLSVGILLAYATTLQWLITARRRLALNQARARREAERASQEVESGGESGLSPSALELEARLIDLPQLNRQVLQLVNGTALLLFLFGCWAIWIQVLPALQVISRIELWSTQRVFSQIDESVDGVSAMLEVTKNVPTTLGHLLSALGLLSVALLASRTLPSLLAVSLLPKLPIDKGTRDAIDLLTGYALAIGGLIVASAIIGIQWNSIQWLVAALTVGLGFGLQEIFANFVSGIIILFERPIRLGDVVTIDGVSGTVSQIRIRATTITDWDRKEYIVPNKEFIAGKLLNWTRTDRVNRIVINVGIAYGSDIQNALKILKEVAENHPSVLSEPAPSSTFEGFGDSALQLVLRCFLANLDQRMSIVTQLHTEIAKRFQEEKIEIPFPQRDVHLRSVPHPWPPTGAKHD